MKKEKEQKLPKVFKRKWLAALRSGEYKQGINVLKSTQNGITTYCCLGVACEIVNGKYLPDNLEYGFIEPSRTPSKKDYYKGIPELLIGCSENDVVDKLVKMNDGDNMKKPKSFKQIANWIEKHL